MRHSALTRQETRCRGTPPAMRAAQPILDRTGHGPKSQVEVTAKARIISKSATADDLRRELDELNAGMAEMPPPGSST